jgi:hypothetical protein
MVAEHQDRSCTAASDPRFDMVATALHLVADDLCSDPFHEQGGDQVGDPIA